MGRSSYFSYINNIIVNDIAIKNIFKKFVINEKYLGLTYIFKEHSITDGETPETLSYNYYGDKKYFWIILLSNNIQDYFYDWPLKDTELRNYAERYVQKILDDIEENLQPGETLEEKFIEEYGESGETISDFLSVKNRVIETTYLDNYTDNENKRTIKYLNPDLLPNLLYTMENA